MLNRRVLIQYKERLKHFFVYLKQAYLIDSVTFNESEYLKANPDVATAIKVGRFLKSYIIPTVLLFVAFIFAVNNISSVLNWHVAIPFSDEWDEFPTLLAFQEKGYPMWDFLTYIWAQHSEHRIVLPKIIYLIDLTYFSYEGYFAIVCIFLYQIMLVGMIAWLLVDKKKESWANLLLVSLAIIAAFNLIQSENFVSTFQTSFVGCFSFAVAALITYSKYIVNNKSLYFWSSVLFAIATCLSLASGLFIWVALAVLAYFIHEKRYTQPAIFIGVFVTSLLLYLHGYTSPGYHANPINSLTHHPLMVLHYLTVWLGNITGNTSSAKILGSMGLIVMTAIAIFLVKNKNGIKYIKVYTLMSICLFILITGFVTSLGRINFGIDQATASRYVTPALIFWISLLGSILLLTLESGKLLFIRCSVVLILVAIISLLMSNDRGEKFMVEFQNQQIQSYIAIVTGEYVEQTQLLLPIYPAPNLIIDKIKLLKNRHLSLFATSEVNQYEMGSLFPLLGEQQNGYCKGHIDTVSAITKDVYQVTGWAWNEISSSYPEWIYLVRNGKVVGLAKPGAKRPDVLKVTPSINKIRVGWQGVARNTEDFGLNNIEAYISTKEGEYCRL